MSPDVSTDYPALAALRARMAAAGGKLGADDAPAVLDALREFLRDGARLGRSLRDDLAGFRPADPLGATLCYLFVITVDAATHGGREGALKAYAASDQPLAAEAGELYALLTAPAFGQATGPRPTVSVRKDGRGCGGH